MFDHCPFPQVTEAAPALQQSWLWHDALRRLRRRARFRHVAGQRLLVVERAVPLLGNVTLISRPGGDFTPDATELRAALGARHLIVNAETAQQAEALFAAGFRRIAAPRRIARLSLDPAVPELADGLHPKWRNRLRHGQKQDLRIRQSEALPDPQHWLLMAEAVQARRLRYRPLPPVLMAALLGAAPGSGQLFTATLDGRPVAAMLFLRHGAAATYQIGWSDQAGRASSAGPILMWQAMRALKAAGVTVLDLGDADPDLAPGLARFKLGTGAEQVALGGTWLGSAWMPGRYGGERAGTIGQG